MKDSYALVTGASSGIGYQYAREMASHGYRLIIVSNEPDELSSKAELLRSDFGVEVIDVAMDLGVQSAAQELYNFCTERRLEVEVLINNAGVYHDRDFLEDSEAFNSLIHNLSSIIPTGALKLIRRLKIF